jgi:predicted TPR repeat methyltransferase
LLDVGCGIGLFLNVARERGWDICGVEPNVAAQKFTRADLPILSGTLETVVLPSQRFDLITIWDVLAHVRNPLQLLAKTRELLAENGAVLVKTPNRTYMDVAIARVLNLLRGGRGWLHIPAQLFHFSRQSLTEMLARAGFDIFEIHSTNEPFLFGPRSTIGSPKILGGYILRLLFRVLRSESIIVLAVSQRNPRRFASLAQAAVLKCS